MIAVADTSPVCYLILIGEIDLLRRLFTRVWIPQAVVDELLHDDAPEAVRQWASNLPTWISVRETSLKSRAGMEKLQVGEVSAMLLAEELGADILVLDEKAARRVALDLGLRTTGTLGVLGEAATRGLVDFVSATERLKMTNFRYSPALLKATMDRFASR
jgi:predicted nucleic acid-binding protein